MSRKITWPDGKKFAFTIFDDTDYATLDNVSEVYALLGDLGLATTKSVWPLRGAGQALCGGATCEDKDYVGWLYRLRQRGFEIGYHMATYHSSTREETMVGLERFRDLFGGYPKTMANHSGCEENIYWGSDRLTGLNRAAYNLLTRFRYSGRYRGHVKGDPYFWGDLCRDKIRYVRNFVLPEINTLKACPFMPYHDPKRPFVDHWFASSEGPEINSFNRTLNETNQDVLEEEGGACIMYTHLAVGFYDNGRINSRFQSLMERLSRKNGWFVPVGTLLDYLLEQQGDRMITQSQRNSLERRWLRHKLAVGRS